MLATGTCSELSLFTDNASILDILQSAKLDREMTAALRGFTATDAATPESSKAVKGKAKEDNSKSKKPHKHRGPTKPTLLSLSTVFIHDILFAKRGLQLPKWNRTRKELEKLSTTCTTLFCCLRRFHAQ